MTSEPTRIGVVGTGLIGTSVAMAATRAGDVVFGFDPDSAALGESADRRR